MLPTLQVNDQPYALLRSMAELSDPAMDLGRAALTIAQLEYPSLDVETYLRQLDFLADEIGVRQDDSLLKRLEKLRHVLFQRLGFSGNSSSYDDPRNSFLNDVLDRRLGIPISLFVVAMEVGRRIGLSILGIGLPGHFVAAVDFPGSRIYFDVFRGGSLLTEKDCLEIAGRIVPGAGELLRQFLHPQTKKEILARMLRNLKRIYCETEAWEQALKVVNMILCIHPYSPLEIRDRGIIHDRIGCYRAALSDLQSYLTAASYEERKEIRSMISSLEKKVALLH